MERWTERTRLLLGDEKLGRLRSAHVLVVGLGGVGAYAAEMIVRAGAGRLTIADADRVAETNINRQLVALHSTVGRPKAEVLAERLRDINPDLQLTVIEKYIRDEETDRLLDAAPYDYAVDAIDTLSPKLALIKGCLDRGIPLVSSMGAGAKTDPTPRAWRSPTSAARTTARWRTCCANVCTNSASAPDSAPSSRPNLHAKGR